jgi:hypothetical protein
MDRRWYFFAILVLVLSILLYDRYTRILCKKEGMTTVKNDTYIQKFKKKENRMFPFRYFTDENDKVLPYVAVTGFFRGKDAEERFNEYVKQGIHIFGITAYKSFTNRDMMDS